MSCAAFRTKQLPAPAQSPTGFLAMYVQFWSPPIASHFEKNLCRFLSLHMLLLDPNSSMPCPALLSSGDVAGSCCSCRQGRESDSGRRTSCGQKPVLALSGSWVEPSGLLKAMHPNLPTPVEPRGMHLDSQTPTLAIAVVTNHHLSQAANQASAFSSGSVAI